MFVNYVATITLFVFKNVTFIILQDSTNKGDIRIWRKSKRFTFHVLLGNVIFERNGLTSKI